MTDENSQQQRREQERSGAAPSVHAELPRDAAPAPNVSSVPTPAIAPGKLGIEPVPNPTTDSSLTFDWRAVDLDSNRSFGCTIASPLGRGHTVEIEQGQYKRALRGTGQVQIAVVPLAEPGARGKLVAREDETGATAQFTWQWNAAPGAQTRPSLAARLKAAFSRAPVAGDPESAQALRDAARDPLGVADAGTTGTAIDGEWQCQPYTGPPYALRISGNVGVATLSNAPAVYAPGDTILRIDRRTANGFSGRLLYTHGKFLRIEAVLASPDTIRFTAPPAKVAITSAPAPGRAEHPDPPHAHQRKQRGSRCMLSASYSSWKSAGTGQARGIAVRIPNTRKWLGQVQKPGHAPSR